MKVAILTILFTLLAIAFAAVPQKSVMVSYPDNTPEYVLDDAKAAIKAAVSAICGKNEVATYADTEQGGIITHEYRLIKLVT